MLYPLKFTPLYKERIWGGRRMEKSFAKALPKDSLIGESWELSGVEGDISVISNGFLAGNSLQEAIEIYMGEIVGDKIFNSFGEEFPVLIKFIDAADVLSIQVHPDDELSAKRHNAYGKTEMWYIIDCDNDAELYLGFNQKVDKQMYLSHLAEGTLSDILGKVKVKPGDAYFIPAGAIHAIGKGILIAEIQQTSDVTYRVFDWNRVDSNGNGRELHTELAVDAIDYGHPAPEYNITVKPETGKAVKMQECKYFASSVIAVNGDIERNYAAIDSFVIYICLDGDMSISWGEGTKESITKGETILIPAALDNITINGKGEIIEVYIP